MLLENKIKEGVYLVKPCEKRFLEDETTAFVKSVFKDTVGKVVFVVSGSNVHGIIKIKSIKEITIKQFRELYPKHKINDIYRQIWWRNKEPLYFYEFETIKKYETPLVWNFQFGKRNWIDNIKILR